MTMLGMKHTEETKEKIRVSQLGKTTSQSCKDKLSKAITGIKRSKSTCEKISISLKNGNSACDSRNKKWQMTCQLHGKTMSKPSFVRYHSLCPTTPTAGA